MFSEFVRHQISVLVPGRSFNFPCADIPPAPASSATRVRYWHSAGRKPPLILLRPDEQRITAIVELGDSPHTGEEAGKQPTDDRERWCQRNLVNMVLSRIEWFVDEIVNLVG